MVEDTAIETAPTCMEPRINWDVTRRLPPRALELMQLVTRFEYALKVIGFGRPMPNRNGIAIDWQEFATRGLQRAFYDHIISLGVAPTILTEPPAHQILVAGAGHLTLDWAFGTPPTDVQSFMGAVQRVRNNLVHGGKSGDPDSSRSARLIAEAIAVLTEALKVHDRLRYAFNGEE